MQGDTRCVRRPTKGRCDVTDREVQGVAHGDKLARSRIERSQCRAHICQPNTQFEIAIIGDVEVVHAQGMTAPPVPTTLVADGIRADGSQPTLQRSSLGLKPTTLAPHALECGCRRVLRLVRLQREPGEPVQPREEAFDCDGHIGVGNVLNLGQEYEPRDHHPSHFGRQGRPSLIHYVRHVADITSGRVDKVT